MAPSDTNTPPPRSEELAYAIAGFMDMTASRFIGVLQRAQGMLRRSDLGLLARDGRADLRSRGELAFRRTSHEPEAHLETLARHVIAQRGSHRDA